MQTILIDPFSLATQGQYSSLPGAGTADGYYFYTIEEEVIPEQPTPIYGGGYSGVLKRAKKQQERRKKITVKLYTRTGKQLFVHTIFTRDINAKIKNIQLQTENKTATITLISAYTVDRNPVSVKLDVVV